MVKLTCERRFIMTVIVCVSDGGGMLFGGRRVSRDKFVFEDIARLCDGGALFVGDISESLFSESDASVISVTDPLASADTEDFVFVEDRSVAEYAGKISTLVIYRWNRKYPFDFSLDLDPRAAGMTLSESLDFKGKSHEKITREIWRK